MQITNYADYGMKKKFLDCLEDSGGNMGEACYSMDITQQAVKSWAANDEVFKEAVQQVLSEVELSEKTSEMMPSVIVGTRPYDLLEAINSRLTHDFPELNRHIRLETAKKMCSFLTHYRKMAWNTRQACISSGVSSATLWKWRKDHPEFAELFEVAERESLSEIYDMARSRALDPSASGDAMRTFILKNMGHKIGMETEKRAPIVEINMKNTPEQSEAIVRAHEKALEASMNIIDVTEKK